MNQESEAASTAISSTAVIQVPTAEWERRPNLPQAEEEQQGVHVWALLHAVRRSWHIALPLGVCLAVAGGIVAWKLFEPKYSAAAYLRIDADNNPLVFKTADSQAGSDFKLYKNTQQQLLLTPFVLNSALRDAEVAALPDVRNEPNPIGWIKSNLKVSFPGDSEIMEVSLQTVSENTCVKVVNAIVNAYMQEVVVDERNERLARLNQLEGVYAEAEGKVRSKQAELKALATVLGTGDSDSLTVAQQSALNQFGIMQEKLGSLQFDLMKAEGELKIAQQAEERLEALKIAEQEEAAKNKTEGKAGPSDLELLVAERTPEVIRLESDLASAESELRTSLKSVGASHPSIAQLRDQVAVSQERLEIYQREAKLRAGLLLDQQRTEQNQGVVRTRDGQSYDLLALAGRIEVLKNQESILQGKVDTLSEETRKLGKSSIDVELMRSEIASLEGVLRRVGEEIEQTSIELKTASRVKLISPAVAASPPDPKKRVTRAAAAGLLGLVAPFGLLVLFDLSRKRAGDAEGVKSALSLPIIGEIPMVSQRTLRDGWQESSRRGQRERQHLDNAILGLVSMVLHCSLVQKRRVFMISSAMPGEGKSTIACQLATGLAKAGKKVVLVDFDLRQPSIDDYMNLHLDPGVADVLFRRSTLEESLQATDRPNLSVLTAGEWDGNLDERCSQGAVDSLFEALRSDFDLVIVDGSPVLPAHDSRVIAKYTDGAILTLVRDRSRIPLASQACEILRAYGVPVIGTVLIGADSAATYSQYYQTKGPKQKPRLPGRLAVD